MEMKQIRLGAAAVKGDFEGPKACVGRASLRFLNRHCISHKVYVGVTTQFPFDIQCCELYSL